MDLIFSILFGRDAPGVRGSTLVGVAGLSQDARDVLDVVRQLDARSEEPHPQIHSDHVTDALGRPHGDVVTQHALAELEQIGDLENVTHLDPLPGPDRFTLA